MRSNNSIKIRFWNLGLVGVWVRFLPRGIEALLAVFWSWTQNNIFKLWKNIQLCLDENFCYLFGIIIFGHFGPFKGHFLLFPARISRLPFVWNFLVVKYGNLIMWQTFYLYHRKFVILQKPLLSQFMGLFQGGFGERGGVFYRCFFKEAGAHIQRHFSFLTNRPSFTSFLGE